MDKTVNSKKSDKDLDKDFKRYNEFRNKSFNAGDIIDEAGEMITELLMDGANPAIILLIPEIIVGILKRVEKKENQSKKKGAKHGTKKD